MTPDVRNSVGIVGGGMLGMYLALRLRERGYATTVFEAAAETGGLAAPAELGGFTWDRFYHVILMSDRNLTRLIEELGLSDNLRWGTTRTGFYTGGRLFSLSNSLEFLRFPPLSMVDKFRLGLTIMYASRVRDWRRLEKIPVSEWLIKLSGRRVFDKIWLPLLKSKLGDNYRVASASFIWAIIARMYAARRSGLKREMFGYVEGGYDTILRRLRSKLDKAGVKTICGTRVTGVENRESTVWVETAGGRRQFHNLVLTVPATDIPRVCHDLSETEKKRFEGVVYQGIVCASIITKSPLAGFYVTNITDEGIPFTGVIEMTALVDSSHFNGHTLIYLPRYLAQDDEFWEKSDREVEAEFLPALETMFPGFNRKELLAFRVTRARKVLAVSTREYSDRLLPPVRTSLPNVFVVNSAQIANGTLNVNETLGVVNDRIDELVEAMVRTP